MIIGCCEGINSIKIFTVTKRLPASPLQLFAALQDYRINLTFAAMKILMVCLGNICRSPLAEGILQHKAQQEGLAWQVDSAGTNGYHTGEAPHPLSQKVARLNGIDISSQRSRRFVKEDFARYDIVYAMAEDVRSDMKRISGTAFDETKTDLLLNSLFPGENRDLPDPWYGPEPGYHEVFDLAERACINIIKMYTTQNNTSTSNG